MRTDRELAEKILELALRGGAEDAEVFQRASRSLSAEVRSGEVSAVERAVGMGYGIRLKRAGRPGFYYATQREGAESAVRAALEAAAYAEPDEFLVFPEAAEPGSTATRDERVASLTEDEAIERAFQIEKSTFAADKRVTRTRKAMASFSEGETLVVNSRGVSLGYRSTSLSAHIMSVAEDGGESQMGWGFGSGRFLDEVDFQAVGAEAAARATSMLGARKISAVKAPVVLDSHVAADFLTIFAAMLSAENVQKGKSLLAGKTGQKVISESLDLIDDGLLPHGPGRRPIDDEGVPTSRKVLAKGGVLKGLMFNSRTARKGGTGSTGNAVRGRFSAVPAVGPMCLYIDTETEKKSRDAMFASIGEGLYIIEAMGMHTANPISGQFSIGVSGLWIEGGRPAYPVKEAVISGDVLAFFGNVMAVGDDLRFYGNIGSPTLHVGPTDISA
ncbi:MAG: TldD/PmbA family protein [Nitrospirota bacterium]|jgi:PmbA protein